MLDYIIGIRIPVSMSYLQTLFPRNSILSDKAFSRNKGSKSPRGRHQFTLNTKRFSHIYRTRSSKDILVKAGISIWRKGDGGRACVTRGQRSDGRTSNIQKFCPRTEHSDDVREAAPGGRGTPASVCVCECRFARRRPYEGCFLN